MSYEILSSHLLFSPYFYEDAVSQLFVRYFSSFSFIMNEATVHNTIFHVLLH